MEIDKSINDLKVALKFKPKAFEGKIRYETTGKITRKVNFPLPQTADSTFVAVIAVELLNILDDGYWN